MSRPMIFDTLCREYIAMVTALQERGELTEKNGRLICTRPYLVGLMDQHPYLTDKTKTALWRDLHWIDAEPGHSRKRVTVDGKVQSAIQIDLAVYDALRQIEPETRAKLYREFVALIGALLRQPEPWITGKGEDARLVILRPRLDELLGQHPYLSPKEKIAAWRKLHWIDCEPKCARKRIRVGNGQRISNALQIDLRTYKAMADCRAKDRGKDTLK